MKILPQNNDPTYFCFYNIISREARNANIKVFKKNEAKDSIKGTFKLKKIETKK